MRGNLVCPLSELQAAVLLPQLAKLDVRNQRRSQNVRLLTELLHDVPGIHPLCNRASTDEPAYYKVGFRHDAERFGLARARFVEALRAEGIGMDEGFHAAHVGRSPRRFRQSGDLAEASRAHEGMLVLHHPVLLGSEADIAEVARGVRKIQRHIDLLH
jgi:dTDP-4-amino-4,6-dideoxygalactose transaminase